MKYPIGIQNFESLRNDGYVYVDKTALIYRLVDEGRYYFLSRPRRFGKSLLISTLEAYLSGKKELFKGLAIEQLEKDWTEYLIFHLDLNVGEYKTEASLYEKLDSFLTPLERQYGTLPSLHEAGQRFEYVIGQAYKKTGKRVVILVDEYDKPLLATIDHPELQDSFRSTLKAFYGVLKSMDGCIKFALLTGVTKFGKVSVFSDLNNLIDLSMDERYQTICGITEDEIHRYFEKSVQELAKSYNISCEEALYRLEKYYDGYHFVENGKGVYNPFSLLNTLSRQKFGRYWFETGTPSYLVEVMKQDNYPLPDLTQEQVTGDFLNSIDSMSKNPIPLIYQSGYLTIKDCNIDRNTYLLDFPNEEVRNGFIETLASRYFTDSSQPKSWVNDVTDALDNGDTAKFEKLMTALLSSTSYRFQRKQDAMECERYFQYTFYLIVKMLGFYSTVAEKETSEGRIDCVVECPGYVYIIEFKLNGSAEAALKQIEDKGYAKPYAADNRKVIALGINFSSEKGTIDGFLTKEL